MNEERVRRVFDQIKLPPEQRQAMLDRLLQTQREERTMKRMKKLIVVGIAAALMVTACAAAVVTGLDRRLADYFGAGPEQVELLAPGAVRVDVTAEDNGAVLHISQLLMDRYNILLLADFTAPEGTVLDMNEEMDVARGFGSLDWSVPDLLDRNGTDIGHRGGWGWGTTVLDDGDPLDNHLSLLFRMELGDGIQADRGISGMVLRNRDLYRYDPERSEYVTVYSGDWSCQVPVTWEDMGRSIQPDQAVGTLDGIGITLTELYLSPMTLRIQLESETPIPQKFGGGIGNRWLQLASSEYVTLTTRDGRTVPLVELGGSAGNQDKDRMFRLDEITALEDLEGGTLTLEVEGERCDISLNGFLSPAA